jgi:curved DNA-binding protein CbpA
MKTPYDVLGISLDADEKTIATAFREAAKHCHPDLNPGDHAAERFKEISAARAALNHPAWRALYQYVQFRRQHDRRQWIVTVASCIISAVVSGGLVSLLQQSPMPEPPIVAASLSAAVDHDHAQFQLIDPGADVARKERDTPSQSLTVPKRASGLQETGVVSRGQDEDRVAVFGMAKWIPQQALAAEENDSKTKRAPTVSKEQPFDACHERLENRSGQRGSSRCLKAGSRSEHNNAVARHNARHNQKRLNSHAIERQRKRRIAANHYQLSKHRGRHLRHLMHAGHTRNISLKMPSVLEDRSLAAVGTFPFEAVSGVLIKQPGFHNLDRQMRGGRAARPAPSDDSRLTAMAVAADPADRSEMGFERVIT